MKRRHVKAIQHVVIRFSRSFQLLTSCTAQIFLSLKHTPVILGRVDIDRGEEKEITLYNLKLKNRPNFRKEQAETTYYIFAINDLYLFIK